MRFLHRCCVLVAGVVSVLSSANGQTPLVQGIDALKPAGRMAEKMGRFATVDVAGQDFSKAWQVQTNGSPDNKWDVMLQAPVSAPAATGDTLVVRFWARTTEALANDAVVGVSVELSRDPWTKLAEGQYNAPRSWTQIQLPFGVTQAFDAGTLNLNLRLGFPSQTVEIANVELLRMPAGTRVESLPRTASSYRGIEPDAPWRREALARIEKVRKADLQITVRDGAGKPLAGVPVHVKLVRHAFHFGTAVDAKLLLDQSDDANRYREQLKSSFNMVVYENDLKWPSLVADPGRYSLVDRTLPWLAENGIAVRGHTLVWPSFKRMPNRIAALKDDPAALKQAIGDHITSLATRYRGKLSDWDVLNEPFTNRDVENILGRDAFVDFFKLARAADPDAKLFINDFGILASGNRLNTDHQAYYEELIRYLLERGAPIDGIGFQGHFGSAVTDPETLLQILDRFGKLGLTMRVTELDMNMLDPDIRAKFMRDFLIVCFSHPQVDGVLQWGFWEGRHWLPDAAPFAKNWSLRPHGQAWKQLLSEWTTDQTVVTGADGSVTIRGYLGRYAIDSGASHMDVTLDRSGAGVAITVPR